MGIIRYSDELYQLLLRNAREARELRKQIRRIEKELANLGYAETELTPHVLLNLDFARANMKANTYDQAALGAGNLHGILITVVQQLPLVVVTALPDRTNGVDDVLCFQLEAGSNDCLAGGAMPQSVAGGLKLSCTGSREDCSADTTTVAELAVGRVDDAVHVHFGDALFPDA